VRGYLGLGSNQGDRLAALQGACRELSARRVEVVACSSVYETAPQGEILDQPDFLNACAAVDTDHGPEQLLDICKDVERGMGRVPGGPRHAPRPIDVDVLLLGDMVFMSERLTLPHREVTARRFVLEPLLELEPDLALPNGVPLAAYVDAVADQPVRRLGPLDIPSPSRE
jgi:2-amino-4-hydroxy-6-hydroxymethyldihydropteridine diphosphokinase